MINQSLHHDLGRLASHGLLHVISMVLHSLWERADAITGALALDAGKLLAVGERFLVV